MPPLLGLVFGALCLQAALTDFTDPPECVIELECPECIPDSMPLVMSHSARDGAVRVPHGGEVTLACAGGDFLAYPQRAAVAAACEAGRYRVRHDGALRHLLELGCREDVFRDVPHTVEHCAPPLQGRAYLTREGRHLAAVCYDTERGVAAHARAGAAPPHEEARAPLGLLAGLGRMLEAETLRDAERLYADEARLTRRARELLRPAGVALAGQTLTAARLLAPGYFSERDARAADFPSSRAAVWGSVAAGSLRRVQAAVAALARAREVLVFAGTHGAAAPAGGPALHLRAGGRFPVPRYVWTAVVAAREPRGLALVVLNDPFVSVSEARAAAPCASACGAVPWLAAATRRHADERPAEGLLFCCSLPEFAAVAPEVPRVFNTTTQLLT